MPTDESLQYLVRVELHRWVGISGISEEQTFSDDLTEWVKEVSWSYSVDDPWEEINLTLRFPAAIGMGVTTTWAPKIGDWIVLHQREDNTALAWGYVANVSGGIVTSVDGAVRAEDLKVRCISWFKVLDRAQVFTAIGLPFSIGTILSFKAWTEYINAQLAKLISTTGALKAAFRRLGMVIVPPSIASAEGGKGIRLGVAVKVVATNRDRLKYAPQRVVDPPRGAAMVNMASDLQQGGATVTSILLNSFVPDKTMFELFPSLEPLEYGEGEPKSPRTAKAKPVSPVGSALGANPVLIFRYVPWRTRSLKEALRDSPSDPTTAAPSTQKRERLEADMSRFRKITWETSRAYTVRAEDIIALGWETDDAERINAVTVGPMNQPDNPVRFWGSLGLPITNKWGVLRYGVRLFQPDWPFVPIGSKKLANYFGYLRGAAAQAAYFFFGREVFASGTVECRYREDIRKAGEIVRFDLADSEFAGTVGMASIRPLQAGPDASKTDALIAAASQAGYNELIGYIRKVAHRITVGPTGAVTARTSIQYIRGSLTEAARGLTRAVQFLGEATLEEGDIVDLPEESDETTADGTADEPGDGT